MYTNTVYCEILGVRYNKVKLYHDRKIYGYYSEPKDTDIIVDNDLKKALESDYSGIISNTGKIPKGSSIHMCTPYPYAIDDLRKNYTIKRGFDTGDYNVYCPIQVYTNWTYFGSLVLFPSINTAVASSQEKTLSDMYVMATGLIEGLDINEMLYCTQRTFYVYRNLGPALGALLDGTYTKPCVCESSLDLDTENELTLDMLQLVYNLGKKHAYAYDKEAEAFIIELNALNQYNWRSYKGTVNMLINDILCIDRLSVAYSIYTKLSRYSKPIKEIFRNKSDFISEKDFLLAQSFVNQLLGIGEQRFATMDDIVRKVSNAEMQLSTFNCLFNSVVKITPKTFENVQKD